MSLHRITFIGGSVNAGRHATANSRSFGHPDAAVYRKKVMTIRSRISRRTVITVAALGLAAATVAACSPLRMVNAVAPSDGIEVISDFAYGTHPRQKLDLYRPATIRGPLPTVLFLYGGSWKRGSREGYAFAGRALARHGFLVAVADYRTYPDVTFPAFVHDGAKAVAWLHQNAAAHGGRPDNIHMIGHSAGAHIAALVAVDPVYLRTEGLTQRILGRWVGLAGPYAFYPSEVRSVRAIFEKTPEDDARPVTRVSANSPPGLLLHGEDDGTVYPFNSNAMATALTAAGSEGHAHMYPGVGHAPLVLSLTEPFTAIAPTLEDSVRFLKTGITPGTQQAAR